jgi:transcriptional regulator with XRE-family HTH domain
VAELADRLRSARERLSWNRETLAFHSGVSWSAIAQIETGRRRNIRPSTLAALSGALQVSVDYLVTGRPASEPMLEHRALLYSDGDEFAACVGLFLQEAVERGEPALVVTVPENIERLRGTLGADAARVEFRDRSQSYKAPLQALEGHQSFVEQALESGASWVRLVSEVAWQGLSEPAARAWGQYEALLNVMFANAPATVVCPFDTGSVRQETLEMAAATHPQLMDGKGLSDSAHYSPFCGLLDSGA